MSDTAQQEEKVKMYPFSGEYCIPEPAAAEDTVTGHAERHVMVGKKVVKPKKTIGTLKPSLADYKILQGIKHTNEILVEMKDILDNIWRERRP